MHPHSSYRCQGRHPRRSQIVEHVEEFVEVDRCGGLASRDELRSAKISMILSWKKRMTAMFKRLPSTLGADQDHPQ